MGLIGFSSWTYIFVLLQKTLQLNRITILCIKHVRIYFSRETAKNVTFQLFEIYEYGLSRDTKDFAAKLRVDCKITLTITGHEIDQRY